MSLILSTPITGPVVWTRADFANAATGRLRLWLKMPNARQLAPEFPGRNGFAVPVEAA